MAQAHEFTNAGLNIDVRPDSYDAELAVKVAKVRETMAAAKLTIPEEIDVFKSAPANFRMRAEFQIEGGRRPKGEQEADAKPPRLFYAMFDKSQAGPNGKAKAVEVTRYPMGSTLICELMPKLLEAVHADRALMGALFQVNFLTTLSGEALITMIYHRKLDADWEAAAGRMREKLKVQGIVGRSKKQRLVSGTDFVIEKLSVDGKEIEYKQIEGSFSQPNAGMALNMLAWARAAAARRGEAVQAAAVPPQGDTASPAAKRPRTDEADAAAAATAAAGASASADASAGPTDDFCELYCGSGAFTAVLAPIFRQCVATEISKPAVASAKENMRRNNIENVFLAPLSAEEFAEAYAGVRVFERLKGAPDLTKLDIRCVLVDPPRAGCGPDVMTILQQFPAIVYISCNPATMAQDMAGLGPSHRIAKFAVFDQFPYTPHVECGALLLSTGLGPAVEPAAGEGAEEAAGA